MAFSHGKSAVFKLDNAADSLTDISAYVTEVGLSQAADTAETSVLGDDSKSYVAGLKDGTISISGIFDPTIHAVLQAALGAAKSWEYGPQGETSGNIKLSGEAICTAYDPPANLSSAASWSATLQITGDVTDATYA